MRIRQLTLRILTGSIALAVATATTVAGAPSANAGVDSSLCRHNASRVAIPSDFPLEACYDGSTLYVLNRLDFPVAVAVDGDAGTAQRVPRLGGSLPSAFLALAIKNRPDVVMPGWEIKIPIGKGEARVNLANASDLSKGYAYAKLIWQYAPGMSAARTVAELGSELAEVGDQYLRCMASNNNWGDVGCRALYGRNVAFAVGRAGVSAIATGLAGGMLAMIEAANWADKVAGDALRARKGTQRFTIASAPEPSKTTPAPAQPQQPKQTPPTGSKRGNPSPPQPPVRSGSGQSSQPSTRTVTVQNKYLVGGSGMAEDDVPAYLSHDMLPACRTKGCKIDGTEMSSGATLTVSCYNHGAPMTNENRSTSADDANPNRVDSSLWYWGTKNGKSGYLSEVYLTPGSRGGLGLPHC